MLNPKNAVESTGFQEGLVKVVGPSFVVVAPEARGEDAARKPHMALKWPCIRLDEDTQEPMLDPDGNPEELVLLFGMGTNSLTDRDGNPQIHPGNSDGPVDAFDEVEDLGDEPGTEGPTLFFCNHGYKMNKQSSLQYLYASLLSGKSPEKGSKVKDTFSGCGIKEQIIDDCWAPHFDGLVCHIRVFTSSFEMQGKGIPYKIVDKIVSAPWEKGKGKTAAAVGKGAAKGPVAVAGKGKAAAAEEAEDNMAADATNGAGGGGEAQAEEVLANIIAQMSDELSGQSISAKAFKMQINKAIQKNEATAKLTIPALQFLTTSKWLEKNAPALDLVVVANEGKIASVTFG